MKTALITGITGQDGRYLAELLAGKGYRVVGTSRRSGAASETPAHVEVRELDLLDGARVTELVRALRPQHLYHLAGQSSVGLSFAEPVTTFASLATTTLHVLEAVRVASPDTRVLVAGSGEVFGETGETPATEAMPFAPRSPYAAAKAAAAEVARAFRASYDLFVAVAYLYNHESIRRPARFVTRKIVQGAADIARGAAATLELGDLSVVRDWGFAPEYADALNRMLEHGTPEDLIVATGESHPLSAFVELVFAEFGLVVKDRVKRNASLLRPAEVRVMRADPRRAREVLGWQASMRFPELVKRLVTDERALAAR